MRVNSKDTSVDEIKGQLGEPRPLPMGRKEFEEWSDRLIAGTMLPGGKEDPELFIWTQKMTLAGLLMHLGPTESHKPDAFFVHSLRKFAVNQVADTMRKEYQEMGKAKLAAMAEASKTNEDKPRGTEDPALSLVQPS